MKVVKYDKARKVVFFGPGWSKGIIGKLVQDTPGLLKGATLASHVTKNERGIIIRFADENGAREASLFIDAWILGYLAGEK